MVCVYTYKYFVLVMRFFLKDLFTTRSKDHVLNFMQVICINFNRNLNKAKIKSSVATIGMTYAIIQNVLYILCYFTTISET